LQLDAVIVTVVAAVVGQQVKPTNSKKRIGGILIIPLYLTKLTNVK